MIQFNTKNLEKLNISPDFSPKIPIFLKKIKTRNQGFYEIIDDETMVSEIEEYTRKISGIFSDIVVLGIGGSALGVKTLRDSLYPFYKNYENIPTLHILDNIDPDWIFQLSKNLNFEKTLFIVITKSGETSETLSTYAYFRNEIEYRNLSLKKHMICITGKSGFLREVVKKEKLTSFEIPENIGGRFSILTPVGLLPAAIIGIDIQSILNGAREMRDLFLSNKSQENLPFQLASIQYDLFLKGKTNVVMMPYVQRMKTFSDWYKQLLAESTGKIDANKTHTGLTPLSALGVTDQHSQVQLFIEGINDKQFIILEQKKFLENISIPSLLKKGNKKFLEKKSFQDLLFAELKATADSLTEQKRPNLIIKFDTLSEKTLGQLFLLFEGATAFLGEFLNINAFDQPGVERSKILTQKYLLQKERNSSKI